MHGIVRTVDRLTPHLTRVVLGGEGLADFEPSPFSDSYVNLALAPPGAPYDMPCDLDEVRLAVAPEHRPVRRRYTVRAWDPVARTLTIDFVLHGHGGPGEGDPGVAAAWAAAAAPGDVLQLTGPGGSYAPDPEADCHLMVGDESALPAVAASLERVPAGAPVHVVVEVDGPDDELELTSPGRLAVTWLHRNDHPGAVDLLVAAVRALELPPGRVHAFVHGEAGDVRAVRRHLLLERGVDRSTLSASGYWRRSMTDEAWRAVKREWQAAVAAEA
ncbi:siderophore-interacting protein [Jannaschia sp. R86511]|uniref:siderophore-interacting protein n=1 Tax=Jannaschia sp. R86511 TaxID=3093853 RepID=UPI0036D213BB